MKRNTASWIVLTAFIILLVMMYACAGDNPEQKEIRDMAHKNSTEHPGFSDSEENTESLEIPKTDKEWKKMLTPEQYYVCRQKGTEAAFSGKYYKTDKEGVYRCTCCRQELFSSDAKFDSGTGWPSFWAPIAENKIKEEDDLNLGMQRVEVLCNRCGSHLGHVFNDGPPPTGKRYCINSISLNLLEK